MDNVGIENVRFWDKFLHNVGKYEKIRMLERFRIFAFYDSGDID